MIDEKKKQNGMKACFDRRIDDKVEREFMRDPLLPTQEHLKMQ